MIDMTTFRAIAALPDLLKARRPSDHTIATISTQTPRGQPETTAYATTEGGGFRTGGTYRSGERLGERLKALNDAKTPYKIKLNVGAPKTKRADASAPHPHVAAAMAAVPKMEGEPDHNYHARLLSHVIKTNHDRHFDPQHFLPGFHPDGHEGKIVTSGETAAPSKPAAAVGTPVKKPGSTPVKKPAPSAVAPEPISETPKGGKKFGGVPVKASAGGAKPAPKLPSAMSPREPPVKLPGGAGEPLPAVGGKKANAPHVADVAALTGHKGDFPMLTAIGLGKWPHKAINPRSGKIEHGFSKRNADQLGEEARGMANVIVNDPKRGLRARYPEIKDPDFWDEIHTEASGRAFEYASQHMPQKGSKELDLQSRLWTHLAGRGSGDKNSTLVRMIEQHQQELNDRADSPLGLGRATSTERKTQKRMENTAHNPDYLKWRQGSMNAGYSARPKGKPADPEIAGEDAQKLPNFPYQAKFSDTEALADLELGKKHYHAAAGHDGKDPQGALRLLSHMAHSGTLGDAVQSGTRAQAGTPKYKKDTDAPEGAAMYDEVDTPEEDRHNLVGKHYMETVLPAMAKNAHPDQPHVAPGVTAQRRQAFVAKHALVNPDEHHDRVMQKINAMAEQGNQKAKKFLIKQRLGMEGLGTHGTALMARHALRELGGEMPDGVPWDASSSKALHHAVEKNIEMAKPEIQEMIRGTSSGLKRAQRGSAKYPLAPRPTLPANPDVPTAPAPTVEGLQTKITGLRNEVKQHQATLRDPTSKATDKAAAQQKINAAQQQLRLHQRTISELQAPSGQPSLAEVAEEPGRRREAKERLTTHLIEAQLAQGTDNDPVPASQQTAPSTPRESSVPPPEQIKEVEPPKGTAALSPKTVKPESVPEVEQPVQSVKNVKIEKPVKPATTANVDALTEALGAVEAPSKGKKSTKSGDKKRALVADLTKLAEDASPAPAKTPTSAKVAPKPSEAKKPASEAPKAPLASVAKPVVREVTPKAKEKAKTVPKAKEKAKTPIAAVRPDALATAAKSKKIKDGKKAKTGKTSYEADTVPHTKEYLKRKKAANDAALAKYVDRPLPPMRGGGPSTEEITKPTPGSTAAPQKGWEPRLDPNREASMRKLWRDHMHAHDEAMGAPPVDSAKPEGANDALREQVKRTLSSPEDVQTDAEPVGKITENDIQTDADPAPTKITENDIQTDAEPVGKITEDDIQTDPSSPRTSQDEIETDPASQRQLRAPRAPLASEAKTPDFDIDVDESGLADENNPFAAIGAKPDPAATRPDPAAVPAAGENDHLHQALADRFADVKAGKSEAPTKEEIKEMMGRVGGSHGPTAEHRHVGETNEFTFREHMPTGRVEKIYKQGKHAGKIADSFHPKAWANYYGEKHLGEKLGPNRQHVRLPENAGFTYIGTRPGPMYNDPKSDRGPRSQGRDYFQHKDGSVIAIHHDTKLSEIGRLTPQTWEKVKHQHLPHLHSAPSAAAGARGMEVESITPEAVGAPKAAPAPKAGEDRSFDPSSGFAPVDALTPTGTATPKFEPFTAALKDHSGNTHVQQFTAEHVAKLWDKVHGKIKEGKHVTPRDIVDLWPNLKGHWADTTPFAKQLVQAFQSAGVIHAPTPPTAGRTTAGRKEAPAPTPPVAKPAPETRRRGKAVAEPLNDDDEASSPKKRTPVKKPVAKDKKVVNKSMVDLYVLAQVSSLNKAILTKTSEKKEAEERKPARVNRAAKQGVGANGKKNYLYSEPSQAKATVRPDAGLPNPEHFAAHVRTTTGVLLKIAKRYPTGAAFAARMRQKIPKLLLKHKITDEYLTKLYTALHKRA